MHRCAYSGLLSRFAFQEEKATHAKNDDAKQHNEACNSVEGHIEEDGQEDDGNEKTQHGKEGARALLVPGDDVFILGLLLNLYEVVFVFLLHRFHLGL